MRSKSGCAPEAIRFNSNFFTEADAQLAHKLLALVLYGLERGEKVRFPGDQPARPPAKARPGQPDLFQRARGSVPIQAFAARFTNLGPAGSGKLKGLCPIHTEKTPSFFVSPERQSWRCFGACASGGDVISLAQRLMEAGRW